MSTVRAQNLVSLPRRQLAPDPVVFPRDDLAREVYCVLGVPIDAIEEPEAVQRIETAARHSNPFLLSTPNANFIATSWNDTEFRESLLMSDLCLADGMPIVWLSRLMGLPINHRVSGADLFEALKQQRGPLRPLKAFWFGATEAIAAAASSSLNRQPGGVSCVGWACPGFGAMEDMPWDKFIPRINDSGADFLVAALGARNGQLWLRRNHSFLRTPVRAHLGAVINFEAGVIKRAPEAMQRWGLEWAWRIAQEPRLLNRYWRDVQTLTVLGATRALPLAVYERWLRRAAKSRELPFRFSSSNRDDSLAIEISGYATAARVDESIVRFRAAIASGRRITIDLRHAQALDSRYFGLLLMVRKQVLESGQELAFVGVSPRVRRLAKWNRLDETMFGAAESGPMPANVSPLPTRSSPSPLAPSA